LLLVLTRCNLVSRMCLRRRGRGTLLIALQGPAAGCRACAELRAGAASPAERPGELEM